MDFPGTVRFFLYQQTGGAISVGYLCAVMPCVTGQPPFPVIGVCVFNMILSTRHLLLCPGTKCNENGFPKPNFSLIMSTKMMQHQSIFQSFHYFTEFCLGLLQITPQAPAMHRRYCLSYDWSTWSDISAHGIRPALQHNPCILFFAALIHPSLSEFR